MGENELEFQQIYETFRPRIERYLMRLGLERDIEDIVQETFVKVSKGLESFRGQSTLSTWIYRIATNTAFDKVRSPAFQQQAQEECLVDSSTKDTAECDPSSQSQSANEPSVEATVERAEMSECILGFVNNLPEKYRSVLLLSELEGFKNIEIAEILGLTLGTVKIRLHRGRQKLRAALEGACDFYQDDRNELACDRKHSTIQSPL